MQHPRFLLAPTLVAVLFSACFSPKLPEQVACGEHGDCPPGQRCEAAADVCVPDDLPAIAGLRFIAAPGSAEALTATAPVMVELLDASGERVLLSGGSFTIEAAPNPSEVTLAATTPATGTAVAGIVTFAALRFDRPGRSVRLVARAGRIAATSEAFDVRATRPSIALASPNDELSGCAAIPYQLTQAQSLPVDILVEIDPDGPSGPEPFRRATQGASEPGLAGVQGVPGRPDGVKRVFTWNSSDDLPLHDTAGQLRLTPSVGGIAGTPVVRDVNVKNGPRFLGSGAPGAAALYAADTDHDGLVEMIRQYGDAGDIGLVNVSVPVPGGAKVHALMTGDFDGNGLVDLAMATADQTFLALQQRAMPLYEFAPAIALSGLAPLAQVLAADFDHDGVDELIGVEAASGEVVVLYGTRSSPGQLVEIARPWTQGGTGRVRLADLDHDGWVDLVIGRSSATAPVAIVRGTASGLQSPSLDSGLVGDALAVGDLDHDGRDDIAALESDGLHVATASGLVHLPGITGQVLELGDFDHDGRTDLVAVSDDVVRAYQHVADRRTVAFAPPIALGEARAVSWILIRDRVQEGHVDIYTFSYEDEIGEHSFINVTPPPCGSRFAGPLATGSDYVLGDTPVADLNGDGKPDLLDQRGQIAYGRGDGSFADPVSLISTIENYFVIVPADYDGDGMTDVAMIGVAANATSILYNDPASPGHFDRFDVKAEGLTARFVAEGDVDGDGAPDLVEAGLGKLWIHRGDPAGARAFGAVEVLSSELDVDDCGIGSPSCRLLLDDLDRDGVRDIVFWAPAKATTFLADPGAPGGFGPPITTVQPRGGLVAAANLLPDGRRALVTGFYTAGYVPQVAVYALDATRTSLDEVWKSTDDPDTTFSWARGSAVDLDGDGLDEVVIETDGLMLLSATPELSLRPYADYSGWGAAMVDIDGDGRPELLGGDRSIDVSADGQPDLPTTLTARGRDRGDGIAERIGLGDYDGDGLLDVGVVDALANRAYLARQALQAPGTLDASTEIVLPAGADIAFGDLDGDRRADLLTPGGTSLAFVDVDAASPEPRCAASSARAPLAVGDVTGDGRADVVIASATAVLLFEDPAFTCPVARTVMSLVRPGATTHAAKAIHIADMNGDGLRDVVVVSDAVRIALQVPEAPGTFQVTDYEYEDTPPFATYYDAAVADIDESGLPDVVVIGKNKELRVFRDNPFFPGALKPSYAIEDSGPLDPQIGHKSTSLAIGDLLHDGRLDIVTIGEYETSIFLQTTPGAFEYAYSLAGYDKSGQGGRLSLVDFDRDGNLDIVRADVTSGTILIRGR